MIGETRLDSLARTKLTLMDRYEASQTSCSADEFNQDLGVLQSQLVSYFWDQPKFVSVID
jgi:hypothetical protein